MLQPSPHQYLLISGAITATLVGGDLLRRVTAGRLNLTELRFAGLSAAAVFAAVGLSNWNTIRTLELARQLERARLEPRDRRSQRLVGLPGRTHLL